MSEFQKIGCGSITIYEYLTQTFLLCEQDPLPWWVEAMVIFPSVGSTLYLTVNFEFLSHSYFESLERSLLFSTLSYRMYTM